MLVKKTYLNTFLFILLLYVISRGGIYITTYFGCNLFSHPLAGEIGRASCRERV